jgi:membrane protease YdiL (CAAX protease family)
MITSLKYIPAWLQLLIFGILSFVIFLALSIFISIFFHMVFSISPADIQKPDFNNPAFITAFKIYQAVSVIALFVVPSLVFGDLLDKKPLQYLGFKKPVPSGTLFIAVITIMAAFPMVAWLSEINHNMHLPGFMQSTEKLIREAETKSNDLLKSFLVMKSPLDLVLSLLLLAALPAFAEELFFRGVLQRLFIQVTRSPWTGIIFTAILFSALHAQFLGFIPRMVLGIVLGALYWYSGSLWPGILAHFLHNAVQIVMVYLNPNFVEKEPDFSVGLVAGSTIAVVALVWYLRRISQTIYAEVYDTDDDFEIGSRDRYKV